MKDPILNISIKLIGLYFLMLSCYLILLVFFFYLLSGLDLSNLPTLVMGSIDITLNYSSAMAMNGNYLEICISIAIIILFLASILIQFYYRNYNVIFFTLLCAPFLFFSFKHGIVRHDGHILNFINAWLLIVFLLLTISLSDSEKIRNIRRYSIAILIFILCILFISNVAIIPIFNYGQGFSSFDQKEKLFDEKVKNSYEIFNVSNFNNSVSSTKKFIQTQQPISPVILHQINDKSIDVIPWDISTLWAYDLNWTPRPVMQSYSAYSEYLDSLDMNYFLHNESPKYLLFKYESIDYRYPFFDEPATFSTIINNYRYLNTDEKFLLLEKKDNELIHHTQNYSLIKSEHVNIGDVIAVPKFNKPIYAKIIIKYSFLGKIMKIFYKPSQIIIQFYLENNNSIKRYRVIPELLNNKCYISKCIESQTDFEKLLNNQLMGNDISKFNIIAEDNSHFIESYLVEFFVNDAEEIPNSSEFRIVGE